MARIREIDGGPEKVVLTGMIVNHQVLARVAGKWQPGDEGMFASSEANRIGAWCVRYFRKYNRPPGKEILNLFQSWASNHPDKDTVDLTRRYLAALSREYQDSGKKVNADYVTDVAAELFNKVRSARLAQEIQGDIDAGKVQDAVDRIAKFSRLDIGQGDSYIDVLQDVRTMHEVTDDQRDVLFRYPGALGEFYGDAFERDGFLAYLGPEKRGKTFHLLDVAWRAMMKRRRVAFFEVGDLSRKQIMRRFYTRAVGRPLRRTREGRPVLYPKSILVSREEGDASYVVDTEPKIYPDDVTAEAIEKACRKVIKDRLRDDSSFLRVSVHPNSSISAAGVRERIRDWEADGWIPDVVVLDYADILAAPPGFRGETRDAINETWKTLRRMSQELHCLVVTATQANAASYKADLLGMENFSEDKRKFAHVTGMIGINQNPTDKTKGVQRLNWLCLREDEFHTDREVHLAGCLAIANPAVRSAM